uniref:hypothetical protein n=1 Tax=Enterobacter cloacae complex sp. TaxID=2027919 RepID=UPI001C0A8CBD|nr:hypothetical protein [Enterobacter cloacae complex sp.]
MADINKLIEEIRTAKTFSVTPDQIYDPACYPGALLNAEDRLKKSRRRALHRRGNILHHQRRNIHRLRFVLIPVP